MTEHLPLNNRLAIDRTRLAYERTLMAWVRTATSLISFGFTIYKFFEYLRDSQARIHESILGPRRFALLMITIGLVALILASLEHRKNMNALSHEAGPQPRSLAAFVAVLIAALGLLGLVGVVMRA